jgi:MoaA/NifB/PqqE/SkfB family radical SAM enzyme
MDEPFAKGLMKMELFKSIIDQLEGTLFDVNLFHRGESLIHPKLAEMVAYCNGKGMHTRLHTNAGLMTDEKARALIDAGLSYISFSFDGYTKATYESNRVGGTYETTLANIIRFLEIKKELGRGPFTIVQVMEIGEEGVDLGARREGFEARFADLDLNRFVVRTPHNWGGDFEEFGHGIDAGEPFSPCTFLWYAMTIFFDGTVAPCPQDFFGKIELGSAATTPVLDIWNGEPIRALRKKMKEGDVAGIAPCETCDILARKTFMGVPTNYLSTFIKDNFLVK